MKSKQVFCFRMFAFGLLIGSSFGVQAQQAVRSLDQRSLDPMIDFRSPYSLTEVLQEGLIAIEADLQGCADNPGEMGEYLSHASSELYRLHGAYDEMINRSKMHTVYRDDREFLQKMIDRIDSMISALEGSSDISEQDSLLLGENRDLARQLQSKI